MRGKETKKHYTSEILRRGTKHVREHLESFYMQMTAGVIKCTDLVVFAGTIYSTK